MRGGGGECNLIFFMFYICNDLFPNLSFEQKDLLKLILAPLTPPPLRFASWAAKPYLSMWLRKRITVAKSFGEGIVKITNFFKSRALVAQKSPPQTFAAMVERRATARAEVKAEEGLGLILSII
jgi:hypothetical protein